MPKEDLIVSLDRSTRPLGKGKIVTYPCGCEIFLKERTFPQVDLCTEHYARVWTVQHKES